MKKLIPLGALLLACAITAPAWAQNHPPASPAAAASAEVVEGEVVAVDPQAHRIKIKHGEIESLNMAPMNAMPYALTDDAMLAKLKPGSKIRFTTAKVDGAYVLLTLEEVR
jgi:Cu/Ag efflux protein CusF